MSLKHEYTICHTETDLNGTDFYFISALPPAIMWFLVGNQNLLLPLLCKQAENRRYIYAIYTLLAKRDWTERHVMLKNLWFHVGFFILLAFVSKFYHLKPFWQDTSISLICSGDWWNVSTPQGRHRHGEVQKTPNSCREWYLNRRSKCTFSVAVFKIHYSQK